LIIELLAFKPLFYVVLVATW